MRSGPGSLVLCWWLARWLAVNGLRAGWLNGDVEHIAPIARISE
jgi:hypothetical protein